MPVENDKRAAAIFDVDPNFSRVVRLYKHGNVFALFPSGKVVSAGPLRVWPTNGKELMALTAPQIAVLVFQSISGIAPPLRRRRILVEPGWNVWGQTGCFCNLNGLVVTRRPSIQSGVAKPKRPRAQAQATADRVTPSVQ
jgi:hypothetical protein